MKSIIMVTSRYGAYVLFAAVMVLSVTGCDDQCDDNQTCPGFQKAWYLDADGDGYSDGIKVCALRQPEDNYYRSCELAGLSVDCDDADHAVHPGAPEVCDDGRDNDCDGVTDNCASPPDDGDNNTDNDTNPPATVWQPAPGTSWQPTQPSSAS